MEKKVQKIKHSELQNFVQSEFYKKLDAKPVSEERVASYLNNPHAKADDYILYLLTRENTLMAYRTLLPDDYGKPPTHFAWCSGNYVKPEFRRQGLSGLLLKEALQDWDNKLMYTNYAPESHALYQKTGEFHNISTREGGSLYLRFSSKELLKHRIPSILRWCLPVLDLGIKGYVGLRLLFWKNRPVSTDYVISNTPGKEFTVLFDQAQKKGFNRNNKDLNWIINYPWISQGKHKQKYFFSHTADAFFYRYITFRANTGYPGFAMIQYRDGKLKIPYFQVKKEILPDLASLIINWSAKNKISHLTIWHSDLYKEIVKQKNPFIARKDKVQKVFASWQINPPDPICHDGTGDYIFT